MLLDEYLDKWCKYMLYAQDFAKRTVESYYNDMQLFIRFLCQYKGCSTNQLNAAEISKGDIRAWFLYRVNRGNSARCIARGLSAIKSYVGFMHKEGVEHEHYSSIMTMKPPRVEKTLPRPIKLDNIKLILDAIPKFRKNHWEVLRDRAILILIYSVGLRISEAIGINVSDISGHDLRITGKGGKTRLVPFVESVSKVVGEYICEKPKFILDSDALFVDCNGRRITLASIESLVRKIRNLYGLGDKVTPHALRHSCATHLMEQGADIRHVQELLGHSSMSSTQIYADVANQYMSRVYNECHPLALGDMDLGNDAS